MTKENILQDDTVPDENCSINFFRKIRWAEGVYCPQCRSFHVEKRGPQGRIHRYQCKCGNNFNDLQTPHFTKAKYP